MFEKRRGIYLKLRESFKTIENSIFKNFKKGSKSL